jgi:serine protease Do
MRGNQRPALVFAYLISAFLLPSLLHAAPTSAGLQDTILNIEGEVLSALVNIQPVTETFTRGEKRKRASVGSGFLIDKEGHIVTNYHVAGKAQQLMVTLSNKERVSAELVGGDAQTDLAVIKIPQEMVTEFNLHPLSFGNSSALKVGEFVMALGSPLALARTMTFGIVSNLERYLAQGMTLPSGERTGDFNTWIQTDAAINPGNSGGPLVNLRGEVVGVNARGAMFADNIGFAIPANTASSVVADLIEIGEVERAFIGVDFQPLRDWEQLFGLSQPEGVLVGSIERGGPGELAGLQAGDILLSYDDKALNVRFEEELPALYHLIASSEVGAKIPLTVLRQGLKEKLSLAVNTISTGSVSGERFDAERWSFTVKDITDQMVFELELLGSDGVLVEGVRTGGAAHRGGLRRGVVIEAVEGEPIKSLQDFEQRYDNLSEAETARVLLQVRRYESQAYVLLQINHGENKDSGQ